MDSTPSLLAAPPELELGSALWAATVPFRVASPARSSLLRLCRGDSRGTPPLTQALAARQPLAPPASPTPLPAALSTPSATAISIPAMPASAFSSGIGPHMRPRSHRACRSLPLDPTKVLTPRTARLPTSAATARSASRRASAPHPSAHAAAAPCAQPFRPLSQMRTHTRAKTRQRIPATCHHPPTARTALTHSFHQKSILS
jgi:hypothetical protein